VVVEENKVLYAIHKCQGMTIGTGEPYSYIIINLEIMSLESRNSRQLQSIFLSTWTKGTIHRFSSMKEGPLLLSNCTMTTSGKEIAGRVSFL
jgi:hypothetical protein